MKFVRYEKDGHVARVTLDRPEVLNAMNLAMHAELADVWDDFERDDELWVAVLTGAGDRAFSVGQDLKELVERTRAGTAAPSTFGSRGKPGWPRLTERFDLVKPVVARVRGWALGGGFELALACDIVVADDTATFALTEARLGLIPGAGGVFRLSRQLPLKAAMAYLLTGRRLSATRACELGLVNEVVAPEDLDACVDGWIADILACAPLSVRSIKEVVGRSAHLPLAEAFAGHYDAEDLRMHSNDALEGPLAFVEKRAPKWTAT
ncbi:enoyl-CoA-hydratase DpgD [Actinacidiphila acididurans]|uniref:Enoyl-CoA hydratase/isomerase family protein n=1 Tax=Actinacidiphila acididurans TaxID=2784346 RepID=A0ABS2U2V3_9ACTN|nr:enoyl-CoA-hydratase DpgD [Actinacidiphila acididurans]MBM9509923.1 enoyl-CoA hydratase/isomerase family protein [Actinacidiphila acididurans]